MARVAKFITLNGIRVNLNSIIRLARVDHLQQPCIVLRWVEPSEDLHDKIIQVVSSDDDRFCNHYYLAISEDEMQRMLSMGYTIMPDRQFFVVDATNHRGEEGGAVVGINDATGAMTICYFPVDTP